MAVERASSGGIEVLLRRIWSKSDRSNLLVRSDEMYLTLLRLQGSHPFLDFGALSHVSKCMCWVSEAPQDRELLVHVEGKTYPRHAVEASLWAASRCNLMLLMLRKIIVNMRM
jgi:hypothetical protein